MTILTATVTKVQIGFLEIDGLLLEDGSFGVAVPQIAVLFPYFQLNQDFQNQASKYLKRLMGASFKTTKCKTRFNKNVTSCVSLSQFESVVFELALKGDVSAIAFTRSLIGLSLAQLFSDAFGVKFDKEDRQNWLQKRQQGKVIRRTMTDSIKAWCEAQGKPEKLQPYIICCSDQLNLKVFGKKAKELKLERQVASSELLRDTFSVEELFQVHRIEDRVIFLIDSMGYKPTEAIKLVVASL